MHLLFGSVYAGNIDYYSALCKASKITIDSNEYFEKQSYRNRCVIAGANGRLNLIVPVKRKKGKNKLKEVRVDNSQNWRKLHWKSLESAYRTSPYFEYFEHDFYPIYMENKYDFLLDLNKDIQGVILKNLQIEVPIIYSSSYIDNVDGCIDLRNDIHPKKSPSKFYNSPIYTQVFQDKMNHIPNLSILDLLFNEGPMAYELLRK
tara:strand:- start:713 stop:1324 length:612 start_codon:yes stop_codon:yes gene_type:complete